MLIAACVTTGAGIYSASAAFFSYPRALARLHPWIQMDAPTLPPFAHTQFCLQYPQDCVTHRVVFRGGALKLTKDRWAALLQVNTEVNRSIAPEPNLGGIMNEKWLVAPKSGDCNDYAVTKRHQLLSRGFPSRSLLLAEVVIADGEHHLVLVVRTNEGDLVADNLNANIRPWSMTRYQWVRIESPQDPKFWTTVVQTDV
jgi:predicted transglutaminase-like cysteine proteinase